MKTPDYVMRSLVACTELNLPQEVQHSTMLDALVIIRQLETENHQLLTKAQQLESTISQVSKALCGKENATLKELLQAADQLKARAPRWISVDERLPEDQRDILTVNGHGLIRIMGLYHKHGDKWSWVHDERIKHYNDITHWMPLPEPPEEDDHATD